MRARSCPRKGLIPNTSQRSENQQVQFVNWKHTVEARPNSTQQPNDKLNGISLCFWRNKLYFAKTEGWGLTHWLCSTDSTGRFVLAVTWSMWQGKMLFGLQTSLLTLCFICRNGNVGFWDKEVWIRGFYTTSFLPLLPGLGKQRKACLFFFSPFQMSLLRWTVLTPPPSFDAHFTVHAAPHTLIPPPLRLADLLRGDEAQMTTAV